MRLADLLKPLTWRVTCPTCHGNPYRYEGAWSSTESPRLVWTCPDCDRSGEVTVQHVDREESR